MGRIVIMLAAVQFLVTGLVFAGENSGDTAARIKATSERAAKMAAGKTGELAREVLEASQTNILAAQSAFASGDDGLAAQKIEMAEMQLTVAEAKAAGKELAEETALRRAELKKLEAQLDRYLQGED